MTLPRNPPKRGEPLTEREIEVLRTVCRNPDSAIKAAMKLGLSEHTVRTHLFRMRHKTGTKSTLDLCLAAATTGLIATPYRPDDES